MKLVIIRHGQTDGNVQNMVQGAGVDLPLNEVGQAQAAEAAEKLSLYRLPIIYCSQMKRAKQTAEIIAEKLGVSVEAVDGMEEVHFGEAEGMLSEDAHKKYADIFEVINNENDPKRFDVSIPGGETMNQCIARGVEALEKISQTSPYETAAVVTHGALMYNLYYHFFGEPRRFHNCEFFEIEI